MYTYLHECLSIMRPALLFFFYLSRCTPWCSALMTGEHLLHRLPLQLVISGDPYLDEDVAYITVRAVK